MNRTLGYYEYDEAAEISCPSCEWSGRASQGSLSPFEDLFDVRCPRCDHILLIVTYPTIAETRAAAAAGHPRAIAELPQAQARQAFLTRAEASELKDPAQLPELGQAPVVIHWDFERRNGEVWTVLRHDGTEIWREVAYYEGYRRFADVFDILHRRYGDRLRKVLPMPASEVYLYGDKLSSPEVIKELNSRLSPD